MMNQSDTAAPPGPSLLCSPDLQQRWFCYSCCSDAWLNMNAYAQTSYGSVVGTVTTLRRIIPGTTVVLKNTSPTRVRRVTVQRAIHLCQSQSAITTSLHQARLRVADAERHQRAGSAVVRVDVA